MYFLNITIKTNPKSKVIISRVLNLLSVYMLHIHKKIPIS